MASKRADIRARLQRVELALLARNPPKIQVTLPAEFTASGRAETKILPAARGYVPPHKNLKLTVRPLASAAGVEP